LRVSDDKEQLRRAGASLVPRVGRGKEVRNFGHCLYYLNMYVLLAVVAIPRGPPMAACVCTNMLWHEKASDSGGEKGHRGQGRQFEVWVLCQEREHSFHVDCSVGESVDYIVLGT
jgi:hypothetical protein